jgi:hypothetical protein
LGSARKLAANIYLDGKKFPKGTSEEDLPEGIAVRITNPRAWEGDVEAAKADDDPPDPDKTEGPPPRSGAGSSRDAWSAFAESHDFDVDPDATKAQIIESLEQAGVIEK